MTLGNTYIKSKFKFGILACLESVFSVRMAGFKSLPLRQVLVGVEIPPPAIYGGQNIIEIISL
jgi:hypothetical protein